MEKYLYNTYTEYCSGNIFNAGNLLDGQDKQLTIITQITMIGSITCVVGRR